MTKYMTMQEAMLKGSTGETVKDSETDFSFVIGNDETPDIPWRVALRNQWQVQKADLKVMTARAIVNQVADEMPPKKWEVFYVEDVADKCYKNGRLAEWLRPEQVELREAVFVVLELNRQCQLIKEPNMINNLNDAYNNLKPPTEHTGE